MTKFTFPMTQNGYEQLKRELTELESKTRASATERVNHARSFCDFREDSEYEAALKHRATIDARIIELQQMIQHAEIIKTTEHTTVEIGSTVTFEDSANDTRETYTIVSPEEVDPNEGKISYNAPIAIQLLHAKVGECITLETPAEYRTVEIIKVR